VKFVYPPLDLPDPAVVVGLTLFGFYASRAGQPLFGKFDV
jgi:hypothetical protein